MQLSSVGLLVAGIQRQEYKPHVTGDVQPDDRSTSLVGEATAERSETGHNAASRRRESPKASAFASR